MRPEETALLHGAGRLRCLGGQQHLKSKYGGGYTLELRVKEGHEAGVREAIPKLFARATLEAEHAGKLRYELPMSGEGSTRLARVFEVMESQKDGLGVLDYSASQPSLESIFLAIAEKDINRKPLPPKAAPAAPAAPVAPAAPLTVLGGRPVTTL